MANMMDYLTWRGDLTLAHAPWTMVDSLLMASFCYNDVGSLAAGPEGMPLRELSLLLDLNERTGNIYFEQWRALLYAMADTERFGSMRVHDYVDCHSTDLTSQFSAMTLQPENGPTVVAFRGTDASIVGWHEDCNMSFETVPAQVAAADYLQRMAAASEGGMVVVGHSKGGNLAAYAAAHVPPEVQERLVSVCSFDGPGLDEATLTSPGYARIAPRLTCMIPQSSVVGLLLGYHRDYVIVYSDAVGLLQHDAFTWQLAGPCFQVVEHNDLQSQWLDRTVHDWLAQRSPEERKTFVDALFSLVEPTHALTTDELMADKLKTAAALVQANMEMEPEQRRMLAQMLTQLLSIGAAHSRELVLKPLLDALPAVKPLRLPLRKKQTQASTEDM